MSPADGIVGETAGLGRGGRRLRSYGCLVKAPLGCLSFLAGASFVVAVLLPAALGPLVGRLLEDRFGEMHHGSLELGEVRLSWVAEQSVEGIHLYEPDGSPVGRASLRLPSMIECLSGISKGTLGPIRVSVNADLVSFESGETNLGRALERRSLPEGELEDPGIEFLVEIESSRVTWTNPVLRASGGKLVWSGARGRLELPAAGPGSVDVGGTLEPNTIVNVRMGFESPFGALARGKSRVDVTIEGGPIRSELLASSFGLDLPVEHAFGAEIPKARIEMRDLPSDRPEWTLELHGPRAYLLLEGVRLGAGFESLPRTGQGGERTSHADFELTPFWRDGVVAGLVPFLDELTPADDAARARLELTSFSLPLDGDRAGVRGDLVLHLADASYRLFPERAGFEGWGGASGPDAVPLAPLALRIEEGKVHYDRILVPWGPHRVELSGSFDLVAGTLDLDLELPAELARGAPGLGVPRVGPDGRAAFAVTGTPLEPRFEPLEVQSGDPPSGDATDGGG